MAGRDRWERDRYYEQDRYEDDRAYGRGGGRGGRAYDDDIIRDRPHYDYDYEPRRERRGGGEEYDRRVVIEKDRERDYYRSPSPRGRPSFLRRQSSLDTYDRRPLRQFYEREEYPPPARREDVRRDDFRAPAYTDIPLPQTRALPPARRGYDDRYYDELPPERVHEREIIRSRDRRERDRSRDSHTTRTSKSHTHRSHSRVSRSTRSSSSSSSSGGTTVKSEYPKKGKTKVPLRLVSKLALIDMGYPFVEEGNTIIIQKALGQDNIDQLLKLSEEYKRSEEEVAAARSSAGDFEDRREETFVPPAPATVVAPTHAHTHAPTHVPAHAPTLAPTRAPPATVIEAGPPRTSTQYIEHDRTVYRDSSPSRSSSAYPSGALITRSRSRSRSGRDIRAEIKALERELVHRPKGEVTERFAERLPSGEVILYEESVENVKAGHKPPRIEKDKKGPPPGLMRAMLATLT